MSALLTRIFTLTEFAVWYRLDRRTVLRMLNKGQLAGIRTPAGWRIPDPGPQLLERLRQQQQAALVDIRFVRGVEAAALLGVSDRWIRRLAADGTLPYAVQDNRRVYLAYPSDPRR
jgi:hypothetical protein